MADARAIERALAGPRLPWLAAAAGVILALPTIGIGFLIDDYLHLAILEGRTDLTTPWDLFRFTEGDPDRTRRYMDEGFFTWWTLPDVLMSFWRPLSSGLAMLDHALFGRWAPGYHLHSFAWYAALIGAWGLVVRRALPGAVGGLALVLFAIDDAHMMSAGWVANRNALVASAPALWGLWAHMRWREDGWRPGLPLSVAGLAAGLSGGEMALGVCCYLGAYELFAAPGRLRERLAWIGPWLATSLLYLVAHSQLNYGAKGSGIYIDPRSAPLEYAANAAPRGLALLGGQIAGAPVDLWFFVEATQPLLIAVGVLSVAGFAWLIRWAWPALEGAERRALRWVVPGAVFALAPAVCTFPLNRQLLLVSAGGSAAIAIALAAGWRQRDALGRYSAPRLACGALAAIHIALAIPTWFAQAGAFAFLGAQVRDRMIAAEIDPARTNVVLVAPDFLAAFYPRLIREHHGASSPGGWQVLSLAPYAHRVTRIGEAEIELEVLGGAMMGTVFEQLLRSRHHPLDPDETIEMAGLSARVLETDGTHPVRVGFVFDRPLESLQLLAWREGTLRAVAPPPVGGSIEVAFSRGFVGAEIFTEPLPATPASRSADDHPATP